MAGKLGKFQAQEFQGWATEVTKQNHLGYFMMSSPQRATNLMVELLAENRGKTLDTFLSQFVTKEFDNDHDYTWDIKGNSRRNIPLLYAIDEDGNKVSLDGAKTMIGANKARFQLVFGEMWFFQGEVIGGELNEVYPLRVLGPAQYIGTNVLYDVELMNVPGGMPAEQLVAGKRFSYDFAPTSRGLDKKKGGVRHVAPASMRNEFSYLRLSDKMSADMFNEKIAFGVPLTRQDASGKMVSTTETMWMHIENWEFEKTWGEYKSNMLAFGRSTKNENGEYTAYDESGEPLIIGDGLYAQVEVANTHYYNKFHLGLVEDVIYDLTSDLKLQGEREIVLKTGQAGSIKFHKAVKDETSGWFNMNVEATNIGAVAKTTSKLHPNALRAGYMFTEWIAPNGTLIKVDVDPGYDDKVRNKLMLDGKPAMSSRFDIFDMGTTKEANIFKCQIRNRPEARGYEWGMVNPFTGAYGNENMSHDEDSATMHVKGALGVCVLDPTRTVSLIPAILQG